MRLRAEADWLGVDAIRLGAEAIWLLTKGVRLGEEGDWHEEETDEGDLCRRG